MKLIINCIIFLAVLKVDSARSAEKIFHLQLSDVYDRALPGGLGPSNMPLMTLTDFMSDDIEPVVLISLPGKHADQFKNKNIFIFKNSIPFLGTKYFVCPEDRFNEKCLDCDSDCKQPDTVKKIKKYQERTLSHLKMKLIKEMQFSAKIDQGQNNSLEFQFAMKGQSPISLTAQKGRTDSVNSTIFVLQNTEENKFLICPESRYSPRYLPCLNCLGKLQQILKYVPIK